MSGLWNQTHPDWLLDALPETLGTGIFFTVGDDGHLAKRDLEKDLTYDKCQEKAKHFNSFQWVPYTFMSYEDLHNDLLTNI